MKTSELLKADLHKEFEKFLSDKFDSTGDKGKDETHRWLFCWNGETDSCFDCACCLDKDINLDGKCECICHYRIKQIEDFFLDFIKTRG